MLAKQLGLSWRQVRKVLRELQQDFLVTRIVMKDSKASSSTQSFKGENTHSYCCLDYKRMVDSCRLKMYRLRKYFKVCMCKCVVWQVEKNKMLTNCELLLGVG